MKVAIVALLATLGLVGPAAADVPWTVEPAANQFGADRESYGYTVNPGGQVEDGVVVVNSGGTPLQVSVNATGLSQWVHLDRGDVTVPAGGSAEVPFTLALPDDASPGDHVGDIVTSTVGQRAGLRIRLRVGGPLKPSLSVERVHMDYSGTPNPLGKGDAIVTYTIHNTGNAILSARQTLSASGPFGRWAVAAGRIPDSPALLPGERRNVSVPLRGVTPALRQTATVTLVPLLTDAAGSTASLAATKTSGHAWTVPWALLLAIIVLCGLVVSRLAFRRSSRRCHTRATARPRSQES